MLTVSWAEGATFDVYNYLKTELVKQGIPADQIAFIQDAKTDAARDSLFREMRSGTKRILIGSTDKCGTGVNVQAHLTAMHHVDCPWKPSSIEQRAGIGEYRGFEVQVEKNFIGVNYLILHGRTDYKVELSNSPVGCMVKLENCFNGMDGNIEFLEKKLEQYQRDMEQAKAEYEKPFAYEEELKSKTARQFELNTQLDLENKPITEENGQELSQVVENAYPYGERKDYR